MTHEVALRTRQAASSLLLHEKIDADLLFQLCPAGDPEIIYRSDADGRRIVEAQRRILERLPTPEQATAVRQAIQAAIQVRTNAGLARAVVRLISAYPHSKPHDQYLETIEDALADFPDTVVVEATRIAIRTSKWLPTAADLFSLAQEIDAKWKSVLRCLDKIDVQRTAYKDAIASNIATLETPDNGFDPQRALAQLDKDLSNLRAKQ